MQGDNKKTAEPRQGPHKCIFQIICPWRRSRGPATSVVSHVPMIPRSPYPAAPSSAIRTSVGHASSPRPLDPPLLLHSQPDPERSGLMGILSTIVQHAAFPWRWTTSKEPPAYSTIANDLVITTTPSASAAESMNPHPYFYPSNITAHDAFVGLPGVHMDCTIDTTAYNIPENLEACLRKNPTCVRILGVLSAFKEPPSILQIARVLGWTSETAFEVLRPILWHLGPVTDHFSDLTLEEPLIAWLFDPAKSGPLCCNKTECNNLIARWCLADNKNCDVRDIEYATRYWLYHINQSIPTQELCAMIMASRFVLAPSWSKKLNEIEIWLRKHNEGAEVKYLDMFRVFQQTTFHNL